MDENITIINLADERSTRQQASSLASLETAYRQALDDARPVDMATAIRTLTPCLVLCSPSGMTQADREEWLVAAYNALCDIPGSIFVEACRAAQSACDHPAKIVPYISAMTVLQADNLRSLVELRKKQLDNGHAPRIVPKPAEPEIPLPPMTIEEIRSWLPAFRQVALNSGFITQEQFDAAHPY